jgi:hypothetical protein
MNTKSLSLLLALMTLPASTLTAAPPTYTIQKQGNQMFLVPQGVIKKGPQSYSRSDPANPYRNGTDYAGKSNTERAERTATPIVDPKKHPVILIQPR